MPWITLIFYMNFYFKYTSFVCFFYIRKTITNATEMIKSPDEIPPLKIHRIMSLLAILLLVMHVVCVIKHYIMMKENTLKLIFEPA